MRCTLVAGSGIMLANNYGVPPATNHVHRAIDIFAPKGSPIFAPDDGKVISRATEDRGAGGFNFFFNTISGEEWYGAHMEVPLFFPPGAFVPAGMVMGRVGDTDGGALHSFEPHLHASCVANVNGIRRRVNPFHAMAKFAKVDERVYRHRNLTIPAPVMGLLTEEYKFSMRDVDIGATVGPRREAPILHPDLEVGAGLGVLAILLAIVLIYLIARGVI